MHCMLLHIIIRFFIEKKMYVKGIQGHAFDKIWNNIGTSYLLSWFKNNMY